MANRKEGIAACLVSPAQATYASVTLNGDLTEPTKETDIGFTVAPGMLLFHGRPPEDEPRGERSVKRLKTLQTAVNVVAHIGACDTPEQLMRNGKLTLYGVATRQIENGTLAKNNRNSVGSLSAVTSGAITIYANCPGALPGDELFVYAEPDDVTYVGVDKRFKFPKFIARRPVRWSGGSRITGTTALNVLGRPYMNGGAQQHGVVTTSASFEAYNKAVGDNGANDIAAHVAAHYGAARGGVLEPGVEAFVKELHPEIDGTDVTPYMAILQDIQTQNVGAYSKNAHTLGTLSNPEHDIAAVKAALRGTPGKITAADKKAIRQPRTLGHIQDSDVRNVAVRKGYVHRVLAEALAGVGIDVPTSVHTDHTFTLPSTSTWSDATVVGKDGTKTTFRRRLHEGHAELEVKEGSNTASVLSAAKNGVVNFEEGGSMSADFVRANDGMAGTIALKVIPTEAPMIATVEGAVIPDPDTTNIFPRTQRVGIVLENNVSAASIRVALSIIPDKRSNSGPNTASNQHNVYEVMTNYDDNRMSAWREPAVAPQQAVHAQCFVDREIVAGELLYTYGRKHGGRNPGYIVGPGPKDEDRLVPDDCTCIVGPFFGVAAENITPTKANGVNELMRTTAIVAGAVTVHNDKAGHWPVNSMLIGRRATREFITRAELTARSAVPNAEPRKIKFWIISSGYVVAEPCVIGRVLTRERNAATVLLHRGSAPLPQLNLLSKGCTAADINGAIARFRAVRGNNLLNEANDGRQIADNFYRLQRKQMLQELAAVQRIVVTPLVPNGNVIYQPGQDVGGIPNRKSAFWEPHRSAFFFDDDVTRADLGVGRVIGNVTWYDIRLLDVATDTTNLRCREVAFNQAVNIRDVLVPNDRPRAAKKALIAAHKARTI